MSFNAERQIDSDSGTLIDEIRLLTSAIANHRAATVGHGSCWRNDLELWKVVDPAAVYPHADVPDPEAFKIACAKYHEGLVRNAPVIDPRDSVEYFRLKFDCETGRRGLPGWVFAGGAEDLWLKRWNDPDEFPLLKVRRERLQNWVWTVHGPGYSRIGDGIENCALAAMEAADKKAHERIIKP